MSVSPRHYCYDTRFLEDGYTIDLISIGIVCDDGREYYAVNFDADWGRIQKDDWLIDNVSIGQVKNGEWPNMRDARVKPKWVIANEVREFILESPRSGDTPHLWSYYGAYDYVALVQLFGKMTSIPDGIPMFTHELKQLMETMPGSWEPPPNGGEHDALADARWSMRVLQDIQESHQIQESHRREWRW